LGGSVISAGTGKDRHFIGNWRPISLLNTDLKIASAVIANRVKPLLPFIISDTQKGFYKRKIYWGKYKTVV
jgi:hypothetical protein